VPKVLRPQDFDQGFRFAAIPIEDPRDLTSIEALIRMSGVSADGVPPSLVLTELEVIQCLRGGGSEVRIQGPISEHNRLDEYWRAYKHEMLLVVQLGLQEEARRFHVVEGLKAERRRVGPWRANADELLLVELVFAFRIYLQYS